MTAETYLSRIPVHIADALRARGIEISSIISYGYTDMDKDGNFADCWIFFDKDNLYYLTGYDKVEKTGGRKKLKTVFDFVSFDSIPHEDIKSLEIERYVSTARLVAKKKDENEPNEELIRFSLGIANKLDSFTRHFNDFKDGKPAEYSERVDEELFCPKCGSRYPDPEHKVCPRCMDKGSVFKRLLGFFKFYKNKLIAYFAMLIISTVFSVLSPYVGTKLLYDNVLTPGVDANLFGEVGLVLAVIILARVASLLINIGQ